MISYPHKNLKWKHKNIYECTDCKLYTFDFESWFTETTSWAGIILVRNNTLTEGGMQYVANFSNNICGNPSKPLQITKVFNHIKLKIPKAILDDSNGTHVYLTPENKRYKSITTMINETKSEESKKTLQEWREKTGERTADYIFLNSGITGKATHKLNEDYVNMKSESSCSNLMASSHYENFKPYLDKITKVYGTELVVYSDVMKLGGTVDCVGVYDGKLSIIDYKTKRSKQKDEYITDYFIQTTAYAKMLKELTNGKKEIKQLVILVSSEQNTIQEFIDIPANYEDMVNKRLAEFRKIVGDE